MYKQIVICMNKTNISQPEGYRKCFMGLGCSFYYSELSFQYFVKLKYQHHSSVVNDTYINKDINIHQPERYLWKLCLHSSKNKMWWDILFCPI